MNRDKINLMAPVGSFESLVAAYQGGANSIYFGVENLNMRARSSVNFTLNDLIKIVDYCQEHNMESYLTLNVAVYNHELLKAYQIIDCAKKAGISAIIAADPAVLQYAKNCNMPIHISTQANISNIESVRFYAHYANVMVLARELTLPQIEEINTAIVEENITAPNGQRVQTELFCHGALCMAVSGKCYLSLHENNYSANRGSCLQTCRKGYIVTEKESGNQLEIDNEYIMSPKDLCTLPYLDKLIATGVSVLKIEGRARSAEYVQYVCKNYRKAITLLEEGQFTEENITPLITELEKVFHRGFWGGYYLGAKIGEWSKVYGSQATKQKQYAGKVTNYFSNIGVVEVLAEAAEIEVNTEILIIGETTGVFEMTIDELRNEQGNSVTILSKGDKGSFKVKTVIRRGDKIYLWKNKL